MKRTSPCPRSNELKMPVALIQRPTPAHFNGEVKTPRTTSVLRSLFDPEKDSPQHFHFDYFQPSELPRNWRENGKTPLTRRGACQLVLLAAPTSVSVCSNCGDHTLRS